MDDFWSECGEEAHHYTYYHKETCNGLLHSIVCSLPSYHDQMSSRDICTENCAVYRKRFLEAYAVEHEASDVDDVDAFVSRHDVQCHSEFCNGRTHSTLCDNPQVHDQMSSYFLCNENCSVYQISQRNLKKRMITPVPTEKLFPDIASVDEIDGFASEQDIQPIGAHPEDNALADEDLLQRTPEHTPRKKEECSKTLRSSGKKAPQRKRRNNNNFADLARRLKRLEDRMTCSGTPHKYPSSSKPRRLNLNQAQ